MHANIFVNPYHKACADADLTNLPQSNPKIRAFHASLPHYHQTPLVSLPGIAKELGIDHLLVKDESSRLGLSAFKILGASWATSRAIREKLGLADTNDTEASDESLRSLASAAQAADLTLYAATDGNHGRAVARMAMYLGIQARIFVPKMLDEEAKSKICNEGAVVEVVDGDYDHTVLVTESFAEKCSNGKSLLISDTALEIGDKTAQWIVDGYQTMFDEIEEQASDINSRPITHVVTPVGVGSLAQAAVAHFKAASRQEKPQIITVEPMTAACLKSSLEAGKPTSVNATYTICTGMCCGTLSASAWPILKSGVSFAVAVDDDEVHEAVVELQDYNIWAGPCGAASLAAIRRLMSIGGLQMGPGAVVVILCTEGRRGYQLLH